MIILLWILVIVCLIWLVAMTVLLSKIRSRYSGLTEGTSNGTLEAIVENLVRDNKTTKQHVTTLQHVMRQLEQNDELHIHKIGLLRFNPFNDTGGDQSFILSLLNSKNTGIVISGLYARSGTRWYAKRVVEGKGVEHELSTEEKKAIEMAKSGS